MKTTRVMVVDDSLTVRSILARLIGAEPDLEIVATASSAELALKELRKSPADVVLLDLEMPGIGGLNALPEILSTNDRTQVLVVSSLTQDGAEHSLTALSMGAADTMPKPRAGEFGKEYCSALFAKIRALGPHEDAPRTTLATSITAPFKPLLVSNKRPELLAIGASTGGIHAMCILLRNLPAHFNLPILVTQHLPGSFMQVFARQLELASSRKAVIAENGTRIEGGGIFVAPGDGHLNIYRTGDGLTAKITRQTMPSGCLPSVDPMLESAAQATEGRTLAIILSGMGRDGSSGARVLADSGGTIFAQDQQSSAVWGMPGAVSKSGIASAIQPPEKLAESIMAHVGASAWK
ncbi:chemotaxis-specific protein-glutamate methyltransferase CheB [Pontixanthobacter gangjinensis]|nr:chemotaxis-specific protein-glutamate methyltransferase CheB [Pontixanthobacter gangjinensis]